MSLALMVGDPHTGKTSTCRRLAEQARARGLTVGGIVAPAVHQAGRCVGYEVVDLATGGSARLATVDGPGAERVGRFHFLAEGLALGRAALEQALERPPHLLIVDEVGPLELAGGGWSEQLDRLTDRPGFMLFVVRRELTTQVAQRWHAPPGARHDLAQGAEAVIDAILKLVET